MKLTRLAKPARSFLVIGIILAFGLIGIPYLQQDGMMFPVPEIASAQSIDPAFQTISIPTSDGETLFALHHPAETAEATILVFHGNGDAALFQQQAGRALADAGFGVLLVEYRGYPGSTGKPSESGLILDGLSAYDFIRTRSAAPVGVYAHSLGSGVAIPLAATRQVFAMVLEAPFDSIQAIAQDAFPWIPMGMFLKHKFRSDRAIAAVTAPLLMIHGSDDRVIAIRHGKALFELAPKGSRFMEVTGAGHNNLRQFGTTGHAITFFSQVLGHEKP